MWSQRITVYQLHSKMSDLMMSSHHPLLTIALIPLPFHAPCTCVRACVREVWYVCVCVCVCAYTHHDKRWIFAYHVISLMHNRMLCKSLWMCHDHIMGLMFGVRKWFKSASNNTISCNNDDDLPGLCQYLPRHLNYNCSSSMLNLWPPFSVYLSLPWRMGVNYFFVVDELPCLAETRFSGSRKVSSYATVVNKKRPI